MMDATAALLQWYLSGFKFDLTSEDSIQVGIDEALRQGNFQFEREFRLSLTARLDFLVTGGVAIEVKRHGAVSELLRQLSRYAEHDSVRELLVVTARAQASGMPRALNGKPVECLVLLGSVF